MSRMSRAVALRLVILVAGGLASACSVNIHPRDGDPGSGSDGGSNGGSDGGSDGGSQGPVTVLISLSDDFRAWWFNNKLWQTF